MIYPYFIGLATGVGSLITINLLQNVYVKKTSVLILLFVLFFSFMFGKIFYLLLTPIVDFRIVDAVLSIGGLVFYGGLLGGIVGVYILHRMRILKKLNHAVFFLPGLGIGHGIGRVGCYFSGCCYGEIFHLPVQLVEAISVFLLGILVYRLLIHNIAKNKIIILYLLLYSMIRFFLEFFRQDKIRGVFHFFIQISFSQIFSVIIIVVILSTVLIYRKKRRL